MTVRQYRRIATTLTYALLLVGSGLLAQPVWPGDANNNGIVNGVDVLYIGWAFGQTGPARADIDTDWAPQPEPSPWAGVFPDGTNFYFADANGNGIVDAEDIDGAVNENFAERHGTLTSDGYANAPVGSGAPALTLLPVAPVVGVGGTAQFELWLGTEAVPASDILGIALHVSYGTVDGSILGEMDFETEEDLWLADDDANFLDFDEHYPNDVQLIDVAMSRTDRQGITGNGKLGAYSVIIEDIVVGLSLDTLVIRIDSVRAVGGGGFAAIPIQPATARVIIAKNPLLATSQHGRAQHLALPIYPNPAQSNACLLLPDGQVDALHLIAPDGRRIQLDWDAAGQQCVRFHWPSSLPAGAYLVQVLTNEGPRYGKLLIIH